MKALVTLKINFYYNGKSIRQQASLISLSLFSSWEKYFIYLLILIQGGFEEGKILYEEGIWMFATNCKMFYFMLPENAIIKSVVFRLFDLLVRLTIF